MPNIATVLKTEILRLARKEVRAEVEGLKKSLAAHRSEIAALKARLAALEKEQRRVAKGATAAHTSRLAEGDDHAEQTASARRFSAKGLAAQRRRLGLSAEDCARLLGVSSVSIYKWEAGTTQPRASFMPAIAELRTLGKKAAKAKLEVLRSAST